MREYFEFIKSCKGPQDLVDSMKSWKFDYEASKVLRLEKIMPMHDVQWYYKNKIATCAGVCHFFIKKSFILQHLIVYLIGPYFPMLKRGPDHKRDAVLRLPNMFRPSVTHIQSLLCRAADNDLFYGFEIDIVIIP